MKHWKIDFYLKCLYNLVIFQFWTSAETFVTEQIINQEQENVSGSLDLFYIITG